MLAQLRRLRRQTALSMEPAAYRRRLVSIYRVPMQRVRLDPTRLADADDPHATLADVRAQAPVAEVDHGFVAVTGFAAASAALRHPGCRSGPIAEFYLASLPDGAARDELGHRINFLDPPDHARVRGVVNKAFTPRRVAELRPWMERTIDSMLDQLDDREQVELLHEVAHQLPSLVISEMLGVPERDRDLLTGFSDEVAPLLGITVSDGDRERAVLAAERFHGYLAELVAERRRAPGDDLLSALLAAEDEGERLDHVELLSLVATLYSAGHRTTRDLFTNGVSLLLADPSRYGAVVDDRWSIPEVVNEVLRLETPTLYVARVTAEEVTLDGVAVAAGTPVMVFLSAANRDPAVFDEPDVLRPGRSGPAALSFAFGPHFCLGAALARSEVEVMLEALTRRWPALSLDPDSAISWHLRGPFRGVDQLVVRPR